MKQLLATGLILMAMILIIPTILVMAFAKDEPGLTTYSHSGEPPERERETADDAEQPVISVFRAEADVIEEVPFEEYIIGVVASEMPASFELEALKAQALAARTYIIQFLTMENNDIHLPDGADITDSETHQVYRNEKDLRNIWDVSDGDFQWKMARIKQAVYETAGEVIVYDGEPITAQFFSTSNGYTENSEEYWANEIAYLRSVESPWDTESPRYLGEKTMAVNEVEELLDVTLANDEAGEIISRTTGGRVAKMKIGGKEFTGRQVRELLELDSSDFTFTRNQDTFVFETRGWGHGVGMSQYGANGMAKEGKTYKEIVSHYYQGVEIAPADKVIGSLKAKLMETSETEDKQENEDA
ncbi:stage II sporulation protein D [Evansella caseinilytica]|uniref:Stage II sporulation protein D n=1 Tax=Evansella caseinilytica TaxID=1503961 RepID=A0A1H3T8C8_9BACI|nr:stage II sporulation protein D [Evansella caseinilytica]SDZ46128.1 stage II sporulation protein D [Evansella caseinilytica]